MTFVGPTHNTGTEVLATSATCAVAAGAHTEVAFMPPVVSPPSTIGTTRSAPPYLISPRTRHHIAAASGTSRTIADYGVGS